MVRRSLAVVGLAATALAVATAGQARVSLRPPAGSLDPRPMVLTRVDLGGAKVTKQRYYKDTGFPSVISYEREFDEGKFGSQELLSVHSEAEIGTSESSTAGFLRQIKRLFASKQGRAVIKKSFEDEAEGLLSGLRVYPPRSLGIGADSFDLRITARVLGLRTELHIAAFRVERVLGALIVVGPLGEGVRPFALTRMAKLMAARMNAQLAPVNTALPVIAGQPQVGQTLTTTDGTWTGGPTAFAYRWRRCDAVGANCVDIPAATAQAYVLTDAEVGSTIRVAVTARGAAASATAVSAQTAVVSPLGAPVNNSPPTISGTAQQGQTLSATTGTWTGNPTSFGFQWQRCSAAGAGCADIAGATAGTYVPGSADAGSTIRVAVTARNSVGAATAYSAATPVVT